MAGNSKHILKTLLIAGVTSLALAAPAFAQPAKIQHFDVPAQDLGAAINQIARQSQTEIAFDANLARGKRSSAVVGDYTAGQALDVLLQGSDLEIQQTDSGSLVIRRKTVQKQSQASDVEELVVTAQLRSERLKDVPVSVVALGSHELETRRILSTDDLVFAVPGISIESVGVQRRIQLRGIGNAQGLFPLVGIYYDDAPVSTTASGQLDLSTYDLDRVEALRGPQGTLFGEGSAGGTLRYITKAPVLDRFEASATASGSYTESGQPSERFSGVVNIPVGDAFALRIAGTADHEGGWIDQPAANRTNFNEQSLADIRARALWQPTSRLTVSAMAIVHRNDESVNMGEDAGGNYTQVFGLATTPVIADNYDIENLKVTYDFDGVQLLNTASWLKQDRLGQNIGYIYPTNPGVPAYNIYIPWNEVRNKIGTEEMRLASTGDGPFRWTVGGTYKASELETAGYTYFALPTAATAPRPNQPLPPGAAYSASTTRSDAWALFGNADYYVTSDLDVGIGLRYFEDSQNFYTATTQVGKFTSMDPRVFADYKLNDAFNLYASAAKGFRSGGFNALNQPHFWPEDIWTYEVGTKFSTADRSLSGDVDVFYSNYDNYQTVVVLSGLNVTGNAGSADVKGVEWNLNWRLADSWTVSFAGDYVKASFYKINSTNPQFHVGDAVPFIPDYAGTVSLQRDFYIANQAAYVRLDYSMQGVETYRNRTIGTLYFGESEVIHMLNLNTNVQLNDRMSAGIFAQNLLNDRGFVDPYTMNHYAARSRPRTFGIELTASMN